jgi:hypothetical protein
VKKGETRGDGFINSISNDIWPGGIMVPEIEKLASREILPKRSDKVRG